LFGCMEVELASRHAVSYILMPAQASEPLPFSAKGNSEAASVDTYSLDIPGDTGPWHVHHAPTSDWISVWLVYINDINLFHRIIR